MKLKFANALSLALILAMLFTSVGLADDVVNNLDLTVDAALETTALTASGATKTVDIYIVPLGSDGKPGCNLTGSTTLVVGVASSNTGVATVSPSQITFANCENINANLATAVIVTPVSAGSANISLSLISNSTEGTFNLAPASFTVNVASANTSTTTTVSSTSATYGDSSVTLSATVSPNPSGGSVSFSVDGSPAGSGSVGAGGVASVSFNPSSLAAGSHSIQASFGGSGTFLASSGSGTLSIGQASSTTTVSCPAGPFTYTGSAQTPCSASVTGAGGLSQTLSVSYSNNINAGTATASASYDGDANHTSSSDTENFSIGQASSTTTVTCNAGPFTYNGSAQTPCSASYTTSDGLSGSLTVVYSNNTDAGTASASASYAGDANHASSSDTENFTIEQASSTTTVICGAGPFTYNGSAQEPCSASYTTSDGLSGSLTVGYTGNINAGTATASASYAGDANHASSSDSENFTIEKAVTVTTVICGAGPFTYNGSAQTPCSATVTGDGDLNEAVTVTYANNVNAGTASASATYAESDNYLGSSDSENFTIGKAATTTTVICGAGPFTYNGLAQEPCSATVTGAGGLNESVAVTYANNVNAGTASASATYAESTNHLGSSDTESFTIDPAPSVVTVTCPANVTYTGSAQTPCTAKTTGAGGLDQTLSVDYTDNTNAGQATASASFAGDDNHTGSSNSANFTIDPAPSVVTVTCPANVTYTGSAQTPCTASVSGAGGLNQALTVSYADNTNAGQATASASYPGDANHTSGSDSKHFTIDPAPSVVTVNCPATVVFNGSAQTPCTASVTGVGGLNQALTVSYTNNTAVGIATASASYAGDANHTGSNGSRTFQILAWTYGGFFQPVDMGGVLNVAKNGSTVPLKFKVFAGGTELTTVASIKQSFVQTLTCGTGIALDDIENYATGGTSLRYDTTGGQFIFNWQTPRTPGACYRVTLTLLDGTTIAANFKLK